MKMKLKLYDPALCCSSGVCGPSVDPVLVQLSSDLEALKATGVEVERFNLGQQAMDFASNPLVAGLLKSHGQDILPLVLLDDRVIASGFYPTRNQFAEVMDLKLETADGALEEAACGCGPQGCDA